MQINAYTVSVNVKDPAASAEFISRHFGFEISMSLDEVASVTHQDSRFSIAYVREGLESFEPASQAGAVNGLLIAFTVDDVDAEYARLVADGVSILTPIETEPWSERYFQVADPNGVVLQLVGWVTEDGNPPARLTTQV